MSTARTQHFHVGRPAGVARAIVSGPKPDDFVPVSADQFLEEGVEHVPGPEDGFSPAELDYDPADHTVDEVKEYLADHPEQTDAILELEENGKARTSLLSLGE